MASRLSGLIAVGLSGCLAATATAQVQRDTADAFGVVSGDRLRQAGALRLADVLALAGHWQVATVDGFAWRASPLGGGPFSPARWVVLVDGQRMDVDLFGQTDLTRLGVPLSQIAAVEVSDVPRLEAGRLTTQGIIHIHTAVPDRGPAVGGRFATGSEIGDAGPFAFTPRASPNVDRMGHDASGEVAYGAGPWFVAASYGSGEMIPSDEAIVDRYLAALGDSPRLEAGSGSLRAGADLGASRHRLDLRHSTVRGATRLVPFPSEVGTWDRLTRLGLSGSFGDPVRRQVGYEVGYTANRSGAPFRWDLRTLHGRVELTRATPVIRTAGLHVRRAEVRSHDDVEDVAVVGAYWEVGPLSAVVSGGEGDLGLAATLRRRWRTSATSILETVASYERAILAEENDLWAWTGRGYDLLARTATEYEIAGTPSAPERVGADARWTVRTGPGLAGRIRGLFRRTRAGSAERDPPGGRPGVVYGVGGEEIGGAVELSAHPWRTLSLQAGWWSRVVAGGDSLYRDAWAAVPRHGARLTLAYAPVPGLDLWLAGAFRSPARQVSSTVTLDAAVQKWLWDRRLRLHFGIRNLTGADLRYDPEGATFAPTAILQVEGRLP